MMTTKQTIGLILKHIGEQLMDENSELSRGFSLSGQQAENIARVIRILSSPSVQVLYLSDLAMRWKVTNRTVQNWIHDGYVPKGRITEGDTRMHWMDHEVEKIESNLVKMGIVKETSPRAGISRLLLRALDFI